MLQELRTRPKQGMLDVKLFIDGKYVDAAERKDVRERNPATDEVIANVAEADTRDVDLAVSAARHAFDEGPWPKMPVAERSAIFMKVARRDPKSGSTSSPSSSRSIPANRSARARTSTSRARPTTSSSSPSYIKYALDRLNPVDDKFLNYTLREPVGVARLHQPVEFAAACC